MITIELANYLIGLDKYIIDNDSKCDTFSVDILHPMNIKLYLISPEDTEQDFMVEIKEQKRYLKVSLHYQDQSSRIGLLRIDFGGTHKNPSEINSFVPEHFKQFADVWLNNYAGHVHYNVDGYKSLAWAIPVEHDSFSVKKLSSRNNYPDLLQAFFDKINLKTIVNYNYQRELS